MTLPLFDAYPGTAAFPRVALCALPTEIEDLSDTGFGQEFGDLEVKRDDLTSAAYGGNKVRKLEFLLGDALEQGARAVITFGAYGSNHALATAVHAKSLGLEPHVVLSPQEPGPFAARTLRAHAGLGTVIHLVDGWDGRRAAVEAKRALEERDGVEPYVIPMGGTNAIGALGYVNAAFEVVGQRSAAELPDVIYVAGGTLGTAVGLAVGFAAAQAHTRVVAVRVTPDEVASDEFATRLVSETVALLHSLDPTFPLLVRSDVSLTLRHDWFAPGYGVPTPETAHAVELLGSEGLKVETTYTGKALAAMFADGSRGELSSQRVMFWDTYNSAPYPAAGPDESLPRTLRDYVAECDRLFGSAHEEIRD